LCVWDAEGFSSGLDVVVENKIESLPQLWSFSTIISAKICHNMLRGSA